MPTSDLPIFRASRQGGRPPLVPTLIVGGAFFLGLVVMALRNSAELGLIVSQFWALWSVFTNRPIIIGLLVKIVLTAVVFAAIALACCLTVHVITRDKQDGEESKRQVFPQWELPGPLTVSSLAEDSTGASFALSGENRPPQVSVPPPPFPASQEFAKPEIRKAEPWPIPPIPPASSLTIMLPSRAISDQAAGQWRSGTTFEEKEDVLPELAATLPPEVEAPPGRTKRSAEEETPPISIEICLLKTLRMNLLVQHEHKRYPIKIDHLNPKTRHLIAYIAWHRSELVRLDDMRTHVFGSEEADQDQVQNAFSTAKRDIRRCIDQAVEDANSEVGKQVFPADLDIFALAKNRKYSLPEYCRVSDLFTIEQQQRIIEQAENKNQLVNSVPQQVKDACDALIKAYSGDFLADLLVEDANAVDPWAQSWAREPFTRLRDWYLQALLYAGEYERKLGDKAASPREQNEHYANAARIFVQGAMAACDKRVFDGRFDMKVFFAKPGRRAGQHVTLSEQLIRRGVTLYGKIGSTTLANRAYGAYEQQMLLISGRTWSAHPETSRILDDALKQTGAYELSDIIATPYELEERIASMESI